MADPQARDTPAGEYDIFLSHTGADKEWVLTLAASLKALGLRVFVDKLEIGLGDNWVIKLSDALEQSRYLVLVLSTNTAGRPWVLQELTSFMAGHGPLGRLLPVLIDPVELPMILKATQALDATHRDASRVADELFKVVGDWVEPSAEVPIESSSSASTVLARPKSRILTVPGPL